MSRVLVVQPVSRADLAQPYTFFLRLPNGPRVCVQADFIDLTLTYALRDFDPLISVVFKVDQGLKSSTCEQPDSKVHRLCWVPRTELEGLSL